MSSDTTFHTRRARRSRFTFALAAFLLTVPIACNAGGGKEAGEKAGKEAGKEESKGPAEVTLTPEAIAKYGIRVEEAKTWVLVPTFVAPGEVAFDTEKMSYVGSPVTGRVAELKARVGDLVKKGDVLIVVDSPEYAAAQADHIQKQAGLAATAPLVEVTRNSYLRAKKLLDDGQTMTLTEVQKRESDYRSADGALRLTQAAEMASHNRLETLGLTEQDVDKLEKGGKVDSRFVVRSPIAGHVINRPVTLGELIRPDKESLITIADLSVVWVLADVPEARLKGIIGAAARIKLGDGMPALDAVVSYIPPQLDPATRTAQVRIVVRNERGELRAGTFTQVEIAAGKPDKDAKPVVAVPEEAIQTIDNVPSVFVPVPGKEHTFVRKAVVLGPAAQGFVTVEAGLKLGQPYVSSGTFVLKAELGKSALED